MDFNSETLALNLGIVFSRKIYKSETILSSKVRPETEVDKYLIFQGIFTFFSYLERMAPFYFEDKVADLFSVPADYVITQLEALTMMYHFCLIEDQGTTAKVSAVSLPTQVVNPSSLSQSHGGQQSEILSNLLHVFLSNSDAKALMASSMESSSSLESARKSLLGTLPRLIACASVLWGAIDKAKENKSCILVGAPKVVRTRLLDLLSPICHHHSMAFLAAIGN